MVNTKELVYKKAHTELYEVIKKLSDQELSKIPQVFIDNLKKNLDNEYKWQYDDTKNLEDQDFLVETKALLVEMYERYLCVEDKKIFWNNYDRICLNMIEDEKKEEYNVDNILKNKQAEKNIVQTTNVPIQQKENVFKKLISFIKICIKK